MTMHLTRSRITKAFTDSSLVDSFVAAEARLDAVIPTVAIGAKAAQSRAGQTAALTALVTAQKCFGRVRLVSEGVNTPLHQPLLDGCTLEDAAQALGAEVTTSIGDTTTHLVRIGYTPAWRGWQVSTWWDRWLTGTRRVPTAVGCSGLPLAGMFAGALAVRQVFAHVRLGVSPREETISLWEPHKQTDLQQAGPRNCTIPNRLWLVGLGHLGQAFVWGLISLPLVGARYAVLQDDQWIGVENTATSILVRSGDIGRRKVRIAAEWLDRAGWTTELIERRHHGDIRRTEQDPPILLSGLDDVRPRRLLAAHGFEYMIDAGIGRGARDFEAFQIRSIPAGTPIAPLWSHSDEDNIRDRLLHKKAYTALEREIGGCGVIPLADASVSVPFVGAATAALALSQLARLAAMEPVSVLLQLEMDAPSLIIDGGLTRQPDSFVGGESFLLD
jgi:hypothetical protein